MVNWYFQYKFELHTMSEFEEREVLDFFHEKRGQ